MCLDNSLLYKLIAVRDLEALRLFGTRRSIWTYRSHHPRPFDLDWAILCILLRHKVVSTSTSGNSGHESPIVVATNPQAVAQDGTGYNAIFTLLTNVHTFLCTGDKGWCTSYFDQLTPVTSDHLSWKAAVEKVQISEQWIVQPNVMVQDNGSLVLVEYPPTFEGMGQSWLDRDAELVRAHELQAREALEAAEPT
jgi:hypothetical protein